MSDVPRLVSVLEAAIAAADARAQADAAIIANLQRQLEQVNNRAYQAEHDRHQAEAHADRAEQRTEGADLAREAENRRADQAEQATDLLQAAFDQSRREMQAQLEQRRTETEAEKEGRREAVEELHAWQDAWQDRLATDATARRSLGLVARLLAAWKGE
jgi:chromosome segregation ATPase